MASKPLQEPAFLVLSALAAGPLHGYGIAQDVESSSDGRVTLRAGTLYGAIDRLVAAGLVGLGLPPVVLVVVLGLLALASAVTVVQRVATVRRQALALATSAPRTDDTEDGR